MDEPLSNLDAKLRAQMRIELAKLHKELETTIIYVTHDQTEAMTLGTRIVVMKDGIVQQVEAPIELYNNPANLFVAGFIGSPAMNFFQAESRRGGRGNRSVYRGQKQRTQGETERIPRRDGEAESVEPESDTGHPSGRYLYGRRSGRKGALKMRPRE